MPRMPRSMAAFSPADIGAPMMKKNVSTPCCLSARPSSSAPVTVTKAVSKCRRAADSSARRNIVLRVDVAAPPNVTQDAGPTRNRGRRSGEHERFEARSAERDLGAGDDVSVVGDLLIDEGREFARRGGLHLEAEFRQAVSHGWRLQGFLDRCVEFVDDRLRRFGGAWKPQATGGATT